MNERTKKKKIDRKNHLILRIYRF